MKHVFMVILLTAMFLYRSADSYSKSCVTVNGVTKCDEGPNGSSVSMSSGGGTDGGGVVVSGGGGAGYGFDFNTFMRNLFGGNGQGQPNNGVGGYAGGASGIGGRKK